MQMEGKGHDLNKKKEKKKKKKTVLLSIYHSSESLNEMMFMNISQIGRVKIANFEEMKKKNKFI